MIKSKNDITKQTNFCVILMNKLLEDMKNNVNKSGESNDIFYGIVNHTVMQHDIIRLRRELNTLSKMIG